MTHVTLASRARPRLRAVMVVVALVFGAAAGLVPTPVASATALATKSVTGPPDLGPNVHIFTPATPQSQIQTTVDAIAAQQLGNQFGPQREALLFTPGTYGSAADPLNFQVGYYTEVAGLGAAPGDVVINGSIDVYNQCSDGSCIALNNFWRSMSNLTINVTNPDAGCYAGEFWAVSQAAPLRRVDVNGASTLMDYCTGPSFASGGFIADSRFSASITSGSQQQFLVRNSALSGWSNGVWNQVFAGTSGAPGECFPAQDACGGPYTTLAATPASREKPYLYVDAKGVWRVNVPAARAASVGPSWTSGPTAGRSLPLTQFYLATPASSVTAINKALAAGQNLLLTPGVYDLTRPIKVTRPDTVVLGLGLATLTADDGAVALKVADVHGVDIAGLIVDAGATTSPVLVQIGTRGSKAPGSASDPVALQDVFFRVGGPHAGKADVSLEVNSSNVILDDIWAWRADHGDGVGWTQNTANTGLVVNGNHVTATGLFVEHYQQYQVIWNGADGQTVFFQSELPYDPPSQAAWMSSPTVDGYAAFRIAPTALRFQGYGMGIYSFFNQGVDVFADSAIVAPTNTGVHLHDLLTIFLDATANGGIRNVVNDLGGSSTIANPDVPVTVVDFP